MTRIRQKSLTNINANYHRPAWFVFRNTCTKTMIEDELVEIMGGGKGHLTIKLTEQEAEALIEYLNKN